MELRSSLAAYIDASHAEDATRGLIDGASLQSIRRTASALPAMLSEFFGFECQLGTPDGLADFLVCAEAAAGGRDVLSGAWPGWDYPKFQHDPIWNRVRNFAELWSNPQLPLFDGVQTVWLEFDTGHDWHGVPRPSIFFGSETLRGVAGTEWLTACALPVLNAGPLDTAHRDAILRCLAALPENAKIFQVGLMAARAPCITRLCIRGMAAEQIIPYLNSVGWPGSLSALRETVTTLAGQANRIDLDLDVEGQVRPKLGLEIYYALGQESPDKLISFLENEGYCVPEKAKALRSWQGLTLETLHSDVWPPELLRASAFMGGRVKSAFVRWLHHVKFVFEPGCPLRAKAYLGVRHGWLTPDMVQQGAGAAKPLATEAACGR
jgi:hypothetical protein